jgi:type IV pilus assembly protein PilN
MQVGASIGDVKADNATMSQEIEVLNQTVRRVEEVDQLRAELQLKLDIITQLKATKSGPVHMLAELSLATPEKLTLTELHEEDYQISLEGYALSPEVISDFMTNLDTSIWFEEVYLIEMEGEVQDGRRLNTFTIQATFVLPGEAAVTADDGEAG